MDLLESSTLKETKYNFFPFKFIFLILVYKNIEQLLIAQILKSFFILFSSYSKDQILEKISSFFSMNNFFIH